MAITSAFIMMGTFFLIASTWLAPWACWRWC